MKKILYGMMAATMIFATSCENELEVGAAGEESVVSFTIATPDMGSRADYSDGTTATVLQYAVYDAAGNELEDLTVTNGEIHGSTTVNLKLTTGNTYSVIFWAAAPNAPYTVDFANKTMTVNYANATSNDESRDAFYKYHEFTVNGAQTEAIELKRPFAQLNIGTNDYAASTSAGYTPTKSKVVVSNVYRKLNLWNGDVDSSVVASFDFAAIDTTELFPVSGFKYLAMNYVLVGADKETVDVEFTYTDGTTPKTRTVGSVPVQRNYRTNIYGQLLTSDVDVNVEIKPEYDGANGISTVVFNNVELQAALDAATTGTTTIYLGKDIEGNVTEIQKSGRKIIIEGGNNVFKGAIKVHSNSNHYADAELTIKNVQFESDKESINFIEALENGSERYSTNITVKECTFTATGAAVNTAVGVQIKASKNAKVLGCTATGLHSLLQAQSCDENVLVQNCTVEGGKNGVAFKQVKNAVVEETKINAAAYGIRFDGNIDNYSITAKYINVTAVQPFIVRKMTGKYNTITLEGNNTLTASEGGYQVVITKGSDDEAYSMPTGSYTLTGAENFIVYPGDEVATTAKEISDAIANGATEIYLTAGNYILPSATGKTISFIGSGNAEDIKVAVTKIGAGGENCDYSLDGSNVTFENITITTNSSTYIGYARCNGTYKNCIINGTYTLYGNSVFENCTFNVSGDVYNIWTWGAPEAKFTDCTFNCDGKSLLLYGQVNTKLTVNNCTFNDNGSISGKAAIEIGNDYNKSYELIVNNTTVNGFDINPNGFVTGTTLWANKNSMPADKLKVTVDGKNAYTIVVDTVDKLTNAIENGATKIVLADGNYTMSVGNLQGKTLSLSGSKNAVIDATNVNANDQSYTGATLTFEGVTINFGTALYMGFANLANLTYKDCNINGLQFLYNKASFVNCKFNSNGAEHSVWTYGSNEVSFAGCEFTYGDRCINVYSEGKSNVAVDFNNCKFSTSNAGSVGAVEINSGAFAQGAEVNFDGCTAPENGWMVFISKWDSVDGANATVTVNGSVISAPIQQ